jgi:flagella basal body P-ring formation protein FlgA
MMLPTTLALAGCLAAGPGTDQIRAGDLLTVFPAMAALSPDTPIGFAPAPGVLRIFRAPELRALAARFHLDSAPANDICVERPVSPLMPGRMLEAMRRTLPEAKIDLLDYSRQPAPQGEIEFPVTGLRRSASSELWTGSVSYARSSRFIIWAKVKVRIRAPRVFAIGDLPAGQPIAPGQVLAMEREEFPSAATFATSIPDVTGKWPRLLIRAGSAILVSQLEAAKDVSRGEAVVVEVRDGAATLTLEAIAQGSGAAGDTILVRNPVSQKCFRARVEYKGRVSVDVSPK